MENSNLIPKDFMKEALDLAHQAAYEDEVPIGAVIIQNGRIVGRGYNKKEQNQDATHHAEILAIQEACATLKTWRLSDCELYVSLEPCLMCAGALVQARIRKVYFGSLDPKGGALGSLYKVHEDLRLNHRFEVVGGIYAKESSELLSSFFQNKRKPKLY